MILTCCGLLVAIGTIAGCSKENAQARKNRDACIDNLIQMDGASVSWALENSKRLGAPLAMTNLVGIDKWIRLPVVCPSGGQYTVGPLGVGPKCSIPDHTLSGPPAATGVAALRP
jgi:hypothetical protein